MTLTLGPREDAARLVTFLASDAATWIPVCGTRLTGATAPCGPAARNGAMLAYDAGAGGLVLFGGCCVKGQQYGVAFDDTWTWDGRGWTQQQPSQKPSPTLGASMAQDGAQGVVLFDSNGDTWTWSNNDWRRRSKAGDDASPLFSFGAGMAFDSATHADLLFGGCCGTNSAPLSETWAWNGKGWVMASTPSAGDAVAVLQRFIKQINDRNFTGAYALLGRTLQQRQPLNRWIAGYADTASIQLFPGQNAPSASGYTIQVIYVVTHTDDSLHYYKGSYVVGLEGGTLKILSGQFQETAPCTAFCNGQPVSKS